MAVEDLLMAFVFGVLEASGPDERILSLDEYFGKPLYGRARTDCVDGTLVHRAMVSIVDEEQDEVRGTLHMLSWMEANLARLQALRSQKILEIQCGLHAHEGCRFLTVSTQGMRLLVDAGCELRFQYMQVPVPDARIE